MLEKTSEWSLSHTSASRPSVHPANIYPIILCVCVCVCAGVMRGGGGGAGAHNHIECWTHTKHNPRSHPLRPLLQITHLGKCHDPQPRGLICPSPSPPEPLLNPSQILQAQTPDTTSTHTACFLHLPSLWWSPLPTTPLFGGPHNYQRSVYPSRPVSANS